MRGAGLRRFTPDPQVGGGWLREIVDEGASGFARGFKSGVPNPKGAISKGYAGGKAAVQRAVKRKAEEAVKKTAKRAFNDLFGR